MKKQNPLRNQEGFTLVEIIAVLIILGILAAVAVPRYIDLESSAKVRAIDAGISELNGRESLTWADLKITSTSDTGISAGDVFTEMGTKLNWDLGDSYSWVAGNTPQLNGEAQLTFKSVTFKVSRKQESNTSPAVWKRGVKVP
jgi:prepilin-type N-terminal cleavage/methylation domain-containing protein